MKPCIACAMVIDEAAKLCPQCGTHKEAVECPECGNFGVPVLYLRMTRHFAVWVFLLILYVIPGLIYWYWQREKRVCPNCGYTYPDL